MLYIYIYIIDDLQLLLKKLILIYLKNHSKNNFSTTSQSQSKTTSSFGESVKQEVGLIIGKDWEII